MGFLKVRRALKVYYTDDFLATQPEEVVGVVEKSPDVFSIELSNSFEDRLERVRIELGLDIGPDYDERVAIHYGTLRNAIKTISKSVELLELAEKLL